MDGITVGSIYRFITNDSNPLTKLYSGAYCIVLHELTDEEADKSEVGAMYRVIFSDYYTMDVFADELHKERDCMDEIKRVEKLAAGWEEQHRCERQNLHESEVRMLELLEAIRREAGCGMNTYIPRLSSLVLELQKEDAKRLYISGKCDTLYRVTCALK